MEVQDGGRCSTCCGCESQSARCCVVSHRRRVSPSAVHHSDTRRSVGAPSAAPFRSRLRTEELRDETGDIANTQCTRTGDGVSMKKKGIRHGDEGRRELISRFTIGRRRPAMKTLTTALSIARSASQWMPPGQAAQRTESAPGRSVRPTLHVVEGERDVNL